MQKPLVVAIILTDLREDWRRYSEPAPLFNAAPTALLDGFAGLEGCEVHVVSCVQQLVASPEKLAQNIFYHSIKVDKWGWMRGGYAGCVMAVRRKLREIGPDIVHGQGTERYCALAAAFSGFANIVTIHGNMRCVAAINNAPPFTFQWLAARLESFTLPRTGGVICISTHGVEAVRELVAKTWLVENAVEPAFFGVQRAPLSPKRIVCPASVSQLKNQNALIEALDGLASKLSFELVFLGNPDPGQEYGRKFLELVRRRPWCVHAGFVADRAKMREFLAGATALVLPSREENCPMVVLEAMAAGVPVAASRAGGIPDLIEEGVTGMLFDPADPAGMCEAVEKLLADEVSASANAERARRTALARFHPCRVAQRHVEIYREVLERGTESAAGPA